MGASSKPPGSSVSFATAGEIAPIVPHSKPPSKRLRHYTTLPVALAILGSGKLMLTTPESWEDQNDIFALQRYRERLELEVVLAKCFTGASETFHHWKIFGRGPEGVCLVFDREKLVAELDKHGLKHGWIRYLRLNDTAAWKTFAADDLALVKRPGYADEREYRILWTSKDPAEQGKKTYDVELPGGSLLEVMISPFLAESLQDPVRAALQHVVSHNKTHSGVRVKSSTLVKSDWWQTVVGNRFPAHESKG